MGERGCGTGRGSCRWVLALEVCGGIVASSRSGSGGIRGGSSLGRNCNTVGNEVSEFQNLAMTFLWKVFCIDEFQVASFCKEGGV